MVSHSLMSHHTLKFLARDLFERLHDQDIIVRIKSCVRKIPVRFLLFLSHNPYTYILTVGALPRQLVSSRTVLLGKPSLLRLSAEQR